MRFMPWEMLAEQQQQNITKAQYQQQVQDALDNWLGIRGPKPGKPPTAGPRPGRPWLGIRRKQQYGYDSALKQREYSKGKPGKKKRGNNKPLTPKPGQKPRHNLLGIAQTLNL